MENLNAEQIKKALEHCKHQMTDSGSCKPCPYFSKAGGCMTELIGDALTLIKCQEDQIFALENRLKECENGYKGTNFLDRCKLHDAEEKVKKLTEENERLRAILDEAEIMVDELKEKTPIAFDNEIKKAKTEAVREFAERLKEDFFKYKHDATLTYIDQIAKEMLEDKL